MHPSEDVDEAKNFDNISKIITRFVKIKILVSHPQGFEANRINRKIAVIGVKLHVYGHIMVKQ